MLKGIDNYQIADYSAFNRINNDPNRGAQSAKLGQQNELRPEEKAQGSAAQQGIDLRLEDIRPRKNASLEDISLSLNEPSGFEMKGRDSDLASLDMEKAVSDMQKDQALMQYQYFVGDTNVMSNEDGIVIAK